MSNLADRFSDAAEAETECDSTEEMCRGIEIANRKVHDNTIQNTTNNTVVLGSMDAIALYPSLRLDQALAICLEMALETDLTVEGADWREMMKYIAVMMPEKEIEKAGMNEFVPRRYTNRGPKPTVRYLESDVIIVSNGDNPIEDMNNEIEVEDNDEENTNDSLKTSETAAILEEEMLLQLFRSKNNFTYNKHCQKH